MLAGGPSFVSEVAKVYEDASPLAFAASAFTYSVTAFYQHYDKLRNIEAGLFGLNLAFDSNKAILAQVGSIAPRCRGSRRVMKGWRLSGGFVGQQRCPHADASHRERRE